jgi:hypothetical protein
MRKVVGWMGACVALSASVAGSMSCGGGSFCEAELADIAGTYVFEFVDGGDTFQVDMTIDDEGNVDVTTEGGTDLECEIIDSDLCDLEVTCADDEGNSFGFSLRRED